MKEKERNGFILKELKKKVDEIKMILKKEKIEYVQPILYLMPKFRAIELKQASKGLHIKVEVLLDGVFQNGFDRSFDKNLRTAIFDLTYERKIKMKYAKKFLEDSEICDINKLWKMEQQWL